MDELDLEIDNYDLPDLLNLFQLSIHFDETDLKRAYKTTLMTHPDKSKLDKKFFLFFTKAFKIIKQVYDFNQKKQTCTQTHLNEIMENDEEHCLLVEKIKTKPNFNKWFNKMFEKVKLYDEEQDTGYCDWLKSNEGLNQDVAKNMMDMNSIFDKKKRESRALIVHKEVEELDNNTYGSSLTRDTPQEYSSSIFSKLQYEDVKKAHTETVVPVTHQDFLDRKHYKNVHELNAYRTQNDKPLSKLESEQLYKTQQNNKQEKNRYNAFKLAKQYEDIKKANNEWWGNLRQLTNE